LITQIGKANDEKTLNVDYNNKKLLLNTHTH